MTLGPYFPLFQFTAMFSFFFRQKCLRKSLKKCLRSCSTNVGKCLKKVIRKYDPDDEEVCFLSNYATREPFLSLSPSAERQNKFYIEGLVTRDEMQLNKPESVTRDDALVQKGELPCKNTEVVAVTFRSQKSGFGTFKDV